jgi:hypothetical protein
VILGSRLSEVFSGRKQKNRFGAWSWLVPGNFAIFLAQGWSYSASIEAD